MGPFCCPCCGQVVCTPRRDPLTEEEAVRGLRAMLRRGHTRESLLREQREVLDFVAPGMTAWLQHSPRLPEEEKADS